MSANPWDDLVTAAGHLLTASATTTAAAMGSTGAFVDPNDVLVHYGITGPGSGSGVTGGVTGGATGTPPGFVRRQLSRIQRIISKTPIGGVTKVRLGTNPFKAAGLRAPKPQEGAVAGIFVTWRDKLLIQKRQAAPATISVPSGFLEKGETFEEAAVRELNEEAQLTPLVDPNTLTLFHTTKFADAAGSMIDAAFYYVHLPDTPGITVAGPTAASTGEVEIGFNFDTAGINAAMAPAGPGHVWVDPTEFDNYIAGLNISENPLFIKAYDKFMNVLDDAMGRKLGDINLQGDMPPWVPPGYFDRDEDIPAGCTGRMIGPDCVGKAVLHDIMVADQYAKHLRLRKRPDSTLETYTKLAQELDSLKDLETPTTEEAARRDKLTLMLDRQFKDEEILIRDPETAMVKPYMVPNPYRALAYREDRRNPVDYTNPDFKPDPKKDPDASMFKRNAEILRQLAPEEMIADSVMATALLESLWFCGANPTLSDDPRCYPAKILGELREWEANKRQDRSNEAAVLALKDTSWDVIKQVLRGLQNARAGLKPFPYMDVLVSPTPKPKAGPIGVTPPGITGSGVIPGVTGSGAPISGAPPGVTGRGGGGPPPSNPMPPTINMATFIVPITLGGPIKPIVPGPILIPRTLGT
jgi:ADP-ribose pyrophosphatase YjhB (NUDIX family)